MRFPGAAGQVGGHPGGQRDSGCHWASGCCGPGRRDWEDAGRLLPGAAAASCWRTPTNPTAASSGEAGRRPPAEDTEPGEGKQATDRCRHGLMERSGQEVAGFSRNGPASNRQGKTGRETGIGAEGCAPESPAAALASRPLDEELGCASPGFRGSAWPAIVDPSQLIKSASAPGDRYDSLRRSPAGAPRCACGGGRGLAGPPRGRPADREPELIGDSNQSGGEQARRVRTPRLPDAARRRAAETVLLAAGGPSWFPATRMASGPVRRNGRQAGRRAACGVMVSA